ncbi:endonuclease/exonuclease/phosphatase family protein [Chitinophaga horti]|uniref:Endonuclease/exonuclease/phosphatase family protein n=1 Tax=Chitinophaga horti TaxID=2920382 RepID=A0ABY6IZY7_9BACT|nr:endonuclease/exonuclease/phosphatase family protein [Chitinophaga horti]UYQ92940.1 endonuclease/exonuclease/phosphatase family protein [Chitinophaga horti]
MNLFKTIIRRLLLWVNVALAAGLLFSAYAQYIRPNKFWPAGFAGFAFPFLLALCAGFLVLWLFYKGKKRYYIFISLGAILLSMKAILQSWAFHPFHSSPAPSELNFTVMSFNCSMFGMRDYQDNPALRLKMYEMLQDERPDILCMQEFYSNDDPTKLHNFDSVRIRGEYPHHYFSKDFTRWDTWHFGTALFSRYPIVSAQTIALQGGAETENMIRADVVIGGDTVRILNAHLKSYQFNQSDYSSLGAVNSGDLKQGRGVAGKMKATFRIRAMQADIVASEVARSPYPVIVTGDFNAIPVSNTYRTIRGDMKDAFLECGFGFGRTFASLAPTLRIDYILPDKRIHVKDFRINRRFRYEHFPITATLNLRD